MLVLRRTGDRWLRRQAMAAALALLAVVAVTDAVAQDSRFTYQGQLKQNGAPVNATPDLEFRLFDQLQGGNQVGPTVTRPDVPVANGLFSVEIDFGASAFIGGQRWIETRVEGQALSPRQAVNAVPLAAYALAGPTGSGSPTIQFPGDRLYAAVDLPPTSNTMLLVLAGVTGSSTTLPGALDVLGYALDATLPPAPSSGGASRPVFGDLRVLVREDSAVPTLYTRLSLGGVIANARLEVRENTGEGPRTNKLVCAETLQVSRVSPLGRTGVVELAFSAVRIGGRHFNRPPSGPAQVASWGYDLLANGSWSPPTSFCPNN